MAVVGQADWAGGIFRAPGGPDGTVYDAINALVTDDHDLLKRGGLSVKSASDLTWPMVGVWDGYLLGGPRTVMVERTNVASILHVLDPADDTTLIQPDRETSFGSAGGQWPISRGVGFHGMVFFQYPGTNVLLVYAGSLKTSPYSTGTVDVTQGSKTVTGHGTTFVGNVDVGMFLRVGGFSRPIASVDSNTQLTLQENWDPATAAATAYTLNAVKQMTNIPDAINATAAMPMVVAGVSQRLVIAQNNRVRFSKLGLCFNFTATDYWDLPAGARVIGADSIHDTCIVCTTAGIFSIANMDFDLTDDAGNVQQQLSQIAKDVILWGDPGIAAWSGALVIPALDDVYLVDSAGEQGVISEGIRSKYREYVKAGYQPGVASVYRGHYLLPIRDDAFNVIDQLVCRLDLRDSRGATRPAWTRWDSGAKAVAWASRSSVDGAPKLFGAHDKQLREATDVFTPSAANKQDPGSTTFDLDVTTRDFDTGAGNRNTVMAAKLRYELVDAASDNPTIAASYSEGPEGAALTAFTGSAPENDGSDPFTWRPAPPIRTRRLRLRFLSSGPSANLKIRVLELLVRSSSRI